jgi:hypothetical protein
MRHMRSNATVAGEEVGLKEDFVATYLGLARQERTTFRFARTECVCVSSWWLGMYCGRLAISAS